MGNVSYRAVGVHSKYVNVMIIYFVFFANFEMRRNLYGEKQTYTENYTYSFCKYNKSMYRDKHISVKGNFGIFLIKSKVNYVFVLVAVGSTHIFLLENIGKYSLYLQHREKKDSERRGMEPLPTKTKQKTTMAFFTIPRNMFRGRYNCL